MKEIQKNKLGFTIIETVVAIGIFGIGILAIIGFYAASAQAVRISRQVTTATFLAQGLIEETMPESYDALTPIIGNKTAYSTDPTNPNFLYQKKMDITLIDQNLAASTTDLGLKKIDAYVYWQGPTGEKQVQITTIKSQL